MQVSFIYYLFIYSFIVNEQPREDERLREGCLIKPRAKVPPQSESQSDVTKGCRVTQCRTENALFSSEHVIQNRESTSRVRICESLLIPSSTSRWVDSYATQAYRCRICPPFFCCCFFLFVFFLGLFNNNKTNLHKIFARWHLAIAMSIKYSQYFLPYVIVSCSKNGKDKGLQVRRAKTEIRR